MAIKKTTVEEFVVQGLADQWLEASKNALVTGAFGARWTPRVPNEIVAEYKKLMVRGELTILVIPVGPMETRITLTAKAAVDNIYALFRSPGRHIINTFTTALFGPAPAAPRT